MKRYSSGLYARLGFSVAIHSNPDIVLVDEVLAVGDAAFRRRALESLRRLIADGKTVLFISHDMWNVRRLCDRILWMDEGRVRAFGAAGGDRRALHERGQPARARQPGERAAEPSRRHRRNPLHRRRDRRRRLACRPASCRDGSPLVVRAGYQAASRVARPVFQVAIVDVDTGLVVATAIVAMPRDVPLRRRRRRRDRMRLRVASAAAAPVRPAPDDHRRPSARVVRRGHRRAAVRRHGRRAGRSAASDDEDGFVSLPYPVRASAPRDVLVSAADVRHRRIRVDQRRGRRRRVSRGSDDRDAAASRPRRHGVSVERTGGAGGGAPEHHRRGRRPSADLDRRRRGSPSSQNGEIYNYVELRDELERAGRAFATRCDTEVIAALYARTGDDGAFARMRGMFAVAIWDARARRLVLARDRVGKKPLYYMQAGDRFLFASEPKAILAALPRVPDVVAVALLDFLTFGYVAGDGAIFDGHAAARARLHAGRSTAAARRTCVALLDVAGGERCRACPKAKYLERLARGAERGGPDPASVGRAARRVPERRHRFGGGARADGEALVAAGQDVLDRVRRSRVRRAGRRAQRLPRRLAPSTTSGRSHAGLRPRRGALAIHYDEPFADASAIPTFFVAELARRHVTVCLTGDGGDELFAGYQPYARGARHVRRRPAMRGLRRSRGSRRAVASRARARQGAA